MTKRQKNPKQRQNVKSKSKPEKEAGKVGRIPKQSGIHKKPTSKRTSNPKRMGGRNKSGKRPAKLATKVSKVSKGSASKTLRGNKHPKKSSKGIRAAGIYKKRAEKNKQVKKSVRKRVQSKYTKKLREKNRLTKQLEELQTRLDNIEVDLEKDNPDFSNKIKPKHERFKQVSKGHTLHEKLVKGFRYWYKMFFPKGDFEDKLSFVHNANLSFLNHALKRNVRAPRAVYISLESEYNKVVAADEEMIREEKTSLFDGMTSGFDFVVNLINIKKMIIDMMIAWQDNFLERLYQQGQSYLEGSGEGFNPDNLIAVSFRFIY